MTVAIAKRTAKLLSYAGKSIVLFHEWTGRFLESRCCDELRLVDFGYEIRKALCQHAALMLIFFRSAGTLNSLRAVGLGDVSMKLWIARRFL